MSKRIRLSDELRTLARSISSVIPNQMQTAGNNDKIDKILQKAEAVIYGLSQFVSLIETEMRDK